MINNLPEYLHCVDLSALPDRWDEVWIAQDRTGDIYIYNKKPFIGLGGVWKYQWSKQSVTPVCVYEDEDEDTIVPNWRESLYHLR